VGALRGQKITFRHVGMASETDLRAGVVGQWSSSRGLVLALAVGSAAGTEVHGSAVLVAPGVALCARHVIEDYAAPLKSGQASALCVGFDDGSLRLWRVAHLTTVPATDLAILGLTYATDLPDDHTFYQAHISTRTPALGERLICLGFRAEHPLFPAGTNVTGTVQFSAGTVLESHPEGRDSLVLPWPCLVADFPAWGGMSGGPVFDTAGRLIGLLSASLQAEDEPSPSYVSLIWPSLGIEFLGEWPVTERAAQRTLLTLERAVCGIDRPEAVSVHVDSATRRTSITYARWE
jgi:hypothetical protein